MSTLHAQTPHQVHIPQRPPPLDGRDGIAAVISYIAQLGLQGIQTLQTQAHTENTNPTLSDHELALALFAEEAEGLLNVARDHALGRNIDDIGASAILQNMEEMEEAARYDHLVSLAISQGLPIPPRPGPITIDNIREEPRIEGREEEVVQDNAFTLPPLLVTRVSLADTKVRTPRNYVRCAVCGDDVHEAYCAPCGHSFDKACLEDMFSRATHDESLYPPKCCQQRISISSVRHLLSSSIASSFDKKASEYETRDRVYCHMPRCSAFLGAGTSEPIFLDCRVCPPGSATCGMCKAGAHPGRKCSATQELNQLATDMHQQQGWQRCYSCGHLVDKTDGCYHITCVCRAQFCYLCAAQWKTCTCLLFYVPPED